MRKLVNGKVVEVDNLELFEMAQEAITLRKTTTSVTYEKYDGDVSSKELQRYIGLYNAFYRSMSYPLYAIEKSLKYATIGNFLKHVVGDQLKMWVKEGLHIVLNEEKMICVRFVNSTWGLEKVTKIEDDNTDMENYIGTPCYCEYSWILDRVINKDKDANFYKEFMPKFYEACKGNPMVLKWELENILSFASIPKEVKIKDNTILDIDRGIEYRLDIYDDGYIETNEKDVSWSMGAHMGARVTSRRIKRFKFELMCKQVQMEGSPNNRNCKTQKVRVDGMEGVFITLCGIRNADGMSRFPEYKGLISSNNIVFCINGEMYHTKLNKLEEPKRFATYASLYSVKSSNIYFTRSNPINESINKVKVYSYNVNDHKIKLCRVMYSY